ncbi:MAG: helix-turn-helix domain-containing protein [bacterium]|nr:helix-turn-helix domain-containing protein [bacterium]MCM1374971.1 helix-turn-helix domain-containing protein [Muribaculum sp.]
MEFGEKLYRLRIERGIYQKQLAAYLHVSVGTISNYENGVHSPDLKTLCKLANYFHVSVDYLLDRTEYIQPIEDLNHELIDQYTTSSIMNAIVELSPESRQDLAKYLAMLSVCDTMELPSLSSSEQNTPSFIPPEPEPTSEE